MILKGEHIPIKISEIRKLIGKRVKFVVLYGWETEQKGRITDIIRRQVCIAGEYIPLNKITEIVLEEPEVKQS